MRAYELVLVLRPSVKDDDRKKLLTTVKDYFENPNIVKEEEWGQKVLSYPIKKETSGYYIRLVLETDGQIPSDLEKRLLTNDNVLRHLLLRQKVIRSASSGREVRSQKLAEAKKTNGEVKKTSAKSTTKSKLTKTKAKAKKN